MADELEEESLLSEGLAGLFTVGVVGLVPGEGCLGFSKEGISPLRYATVEMTIGASVEVTIAGAGRLKIRAGDVVEGWRATNLGERVDQRTKADLKRNDYLMVGSEGFQLGGYNRRSVIVSAAVLLAVIVVAVLAIVIYQNRSEKASEAFGAAMQTYQTPLAAPGQQVPPGVKTFASVSERAKASSDQFLQVAHQYSSTPDGKNALYFAGLTYIEAGQNATAEDTLKKVAGGWNHDLADLARLALAQMYRQTARDGQAIELYNQIAAKPSTAVPAGVAKLQLADLYMGENKPEDARKIYAELKDKDGKSAAGVIAAQKLNPGAAQAPQM